MKIIVSLLLCLLGLPVVAQKISDLPETTTISNSYLFILARPGVANYKITYANLVGALESDLNVTTSTNIYVENLVGSATNLTLIGNTTNNGTLVLIGGPLDASLVDVSANTLRAATLKAALSAGLNNLYVSNSIHMRVMATGAGYVLTDIAGNGDLTLEPPTGGSSAGTNIAVGQTIYLDAAFGNDATASRTNLVRPFLTASNAIAAMRSGDTLMVRGGTYPITPHPDAINTPFGNISGGVMLSNLSNLRIRGEAGAVWKMSSFYSNALTYSCPMLDLVRCTNVVIDGLTMVGIRTNALVAQHYAVRLAACQNVTFRGVTISNWQDQGITDANETTITRDVRVLDCLFTDIGGTNCYNLGADGTALSVNASNLVASGSRWYRNLRDAEVYSNGDVRKFVFEGNISEDCYGISLALIATNHSEVRIANNLAIGYAANAPAGGATWMDIRAGSNVVINGNQVLGFAAGVLYNPVVGTRLVDVLIFDNVFNDVGYFPILIHPYTGSGAVVDRISIMRNKFSHATNQAIWFGGANNSRIEHNEMADCNLSLQPGGVIRVGYPDGTYTNGTNISIVGNKIYTSALTASTSTGIVIYASSVRSGVWNNNISTNYQGQIHDLGTGTFYGSGSTQMVAAAIGALTVSNTFSVPIFNTITNNVSQMNLTNALGSNQVYLGMAQLTNVSFVSLSEGNSLFWNSTMNKFTNAPGGSGGGGSSVANPLSSIQFNSNGVLQGSASLLFTNGAIRGGVSNTLDAGSWEIPNKTNYANTFNAMGGGTNHLGPTVFDNSVTITTNLTILGSTNQITFGATNIAPVSAVAPTKWVSIKVNGDAGVYFLPLYQ